MSISLSDMTGADPTHGPNLMPRLPSPTLQYLIVMYPPQRNTPPATAVALLKHHIAYHCGIGFGAILLYLRQDELFSYVMADAGVKALVAAGKLRLVLWDNVIPMWDNDDDVIYHDQVRHLATSASCFGKPLRPNSVQ